MSINLYLASEFEYSRGLANKLLDEHVIDFCLADHFPWDESPKHDDRIVEVDHRPSLHDEYDLVCDINEFPTVSKDLLEKMLPYESMAIAMGMRRLNYPTSEYGEEKKKYLQHVRYWNYMFDKYHINLIVTHCIPHSQGMYVKYGLARVKGIPFLMWHAEWTFKERRFWGSSLEGIGASIGQTYIRLCEEKKTDIELDEDIAKAYDIVGQEPDRNDRKKYDTSIIKRRTHLYERSYENQVKDYYRKYFRSVVRSLVKTHSLEMHKKQRGWFRLRRRHFSAYRFYKRHNECLLSEYNKMACNADYSQKYVLYLPQVFPEASVVPLAGVFSEQYNSVQILARAAEKAGICVYFKEHPHSPGRSWDFYDEIKSIKNVRFIKTSEFSYDLIKNSIGVATQTGTCVWEALKMKKPVFVFSQGYYWKKCPGVFEVTDEEQGADLIRSAMNGVEINDEDIRRYLYAIQLETIKDASTEEINKSAIDPSYMIQPIDLSDRVELIKRFIQKESIIR